MKCRVEIENCLILLVPCRLENEDGIMLDSYRLKNVGLCYDSYIV